MFRILSQHLCKVPKTMSLVMCHGVINILICVFQIQEFFASAASIMSNQLRGLVIDSLNDLLNFFKIHEVDCKVVIMFTR